MARPGVADLLRTLGTVIVLVAATIVFGVIVLAVAVVNPTTPAIDRIVRVWARLIVRAAGVRVEVHGTEKLDPNQAYVIIANHRSALDIVCLFVAVPVPLRFLAKRELFSIPLFGTILRTLGMVSVDRGTTDHDSINADSAAALGLGHSLVVFAEGTRVASPASKPFKKGGFIIAQQQNVPILPIVIVGSGDVLASHGWIVRGGTVGVVIDDPIPPVLISSKRIEEIASHTQTIMSLNERQWEANRRA